MSTNWNIKNYTPTEEQIAETLSIQLNIDKAISLILVKRGIDTSVKYEEFIRPSLKNLYNPFLMNEMDKAVERLNKAIGNCEKILIYGDYDVDGTTSVALIYRFLRSTVYSEKYLDFYIPDRYDDGYGVSRTGIDYAFEWGAKLIITLDCGIKSINEVSYAKELGIDVIICDHHATGSKLPDAIAVLNPKREDNKYPFEHLCGCGVGFKLLQAFSMSNGIHYKYLNKHLELLALSIASDLVPIIGENRILAYHGLKQINNNPSLSIKGIIDVSLLSDKYIDIDSINYKMGPRINASGRMMNGRETVDLLISKDINIVKNKSREIDEYNRQRRVLDKQVTKEAIELINKNPQILKSKILVISKDGWHKGIIGIVASRIAGIYNRPAIVLTKSNGKLSGSARSALGFDLYAAIEHCSDILINFGGHTYAAGMTISEKNLSEFIQKISSYTEKYLVQNPQQKNCIEIDTELELKNITPKFIKDIHKMAPFGVGNERPIFSTKFIQSKSKFKTYGKDNKNLFIHLGENKHGYPILGIAPSKGLLYQSIKQSSHYSIVYTIEEQTLIKGNSIRLRIIDIKIED